MVPSQTWYRQYSVKDGIKRKNAWRSAVWKVASAGVVKNNSHRVPVTGVQPADAMPHVHSIDAARSLDGAIVDRESDRVALS